MLVEVTILHLSKMHEPSKVFYGPFSIEPHYGMLFVVNVTNGVIYTLARVFQALRFVVLLKIVTALISYFFIRQKFDFKIFVSQSVLVLKWLNVHA